jgi:hypothetical protein
LGKIDEKFKGNSRKRNKVNETKCNCLDDEIRSFYYKKITHVQSSRRLLIHVGSLNFNHSRFSMLNRWEIISSEKYIFVKVKNLGYIQ